MDGFKTFAGRLAESYANELSYLIDYLRNQPLNIMNYARDFAEWVCDDGDRRKAMAKIVGQDEGNITEDGDWVDDLDWDVVDKLPSDWAEKFKQWWADHRLHYHMQHDPAEMPTWAHLSLDGHKALLPRTTWLVHFTDDPYGVGRMGFTIGMEDLETLGLTTYWTNQHYKKTQGGYNFAFHADSRYASTAANSKKYGHHALIFQSAGVEVYHWSDQEHQVIFWGPSVDPRDITTLTRLDNDEGWIVQPNTHGKHPGQESKRGGVFKSKQFGDCADWVQRHYQQYRHVITGR